MRVSALDIRLSILLALALCSLVCIPAKKHSQHQHPFAKSHRQSASRLRHQGTWGSWSVWSECSRTCGGGVSEQSRECLTHTLRAKVTQVKDKTTSKPPHCIGLRKRFQLCNTKPCVGKLPSEFRQEQCAAFNAQSFLSKQYQWEPYLQVPDTNRCELNCRARGFRFYATLAKQVVDGTPCDDLAPDLICVGGECKQVGCDGVIGSEKRFDHCGVCGGDNSTCRIVSGLFTRPQLRSGYNHIASIPRGACNINITELKNSRNYLAIRQVGGEYIINGNWAISWSGEYDAVGTTFTYQRDDESGQHSECITAKGPTMEPLEIMMIYKQPNPGIKYEYTLPLRDSPSADRPFIQASPTAKSPGPQSRSQVRSPITLPPLQDDVPTESNINNQLLSSPTRVRKGEGGGGRKRSRHYGWKPSGFTQCSRSCGGGTKTATIVCVKENSLAVVADVNCESVSKPDILTVRCNIQPCPPEWVLSEWSDCSATCGEGVQTREVSCKQQISSTIQMQVADGTCAGTPADATVRACRLRPCISWTTGEWSKCSVQCGVGKRTRKAECVHADGSPADPTDCDSKNKPENEESCDMGSCQRTWFFTEWSNWCSQECGEGIRTRKVYCPSSDGSSSSKEGCDSSKTPVTSQSCTSSSACQAKWFTGPWTQCSSSCGPGSQNRDVVCLSFSRGQYRPALEVLCSDVDRPDQERPCNLKPCGSEWYLTEWTQCSRSCDSGVQNREVKCLDDKQLPSANCPEDTKPSIHQSCNLIECSKYMGQSDSECVDKFHNCNLVAQSRLCSYDYYRSACCNSCHKVL